MVGQRGWRLGLVAATFLLPSLLPLALFIVGPMLASLGVSLLRWDLLRPPRLVGLDNYARLLDDPAFHAALWHTALFIAGYLPLVLAGGLLIALALNERLRGLAIFRAVYFLPVVTSWVVVALVWKWLLNPASGVVNAGLAIVGIEGPGWWTDPAWAMPSIILASAWKDLGFVMVILLAGLQAIPPEYYEAAEVDGAGRRARFRHVTLPLLSPAIFFVLVISLINSFQVFDQVWIMTGGGPAGATSVVVEQIVKNAFSYGQMGYASAMSWVLFAVILAITLVQFRLQRRWVNYA
jgi:multiple sugar transport system permease protein